MTCSRIPNRSVRPAAVRQVADPGDLLCHLGGRLTPGQVDVGVPGRDRARGRGRAAEVDVRWWLRRRHHRGPLHLVVVAAEVVRRAAPRAADDREEFICAGVPLVVPQVVTEPALLVRLAARHHVEHQAAAGNPLVGRGHLGRQGRRRHPGPERDEELQPLRLADQRRGHQPRVLAVRPGGGEHAREAVALRGLRDLGQVADVRRPDRGRRRVRGRVRRGQPVRADRHAVPAADDRAAVTGGRQEPVEGQAHDDPPGTVSLNVVTV